MHVSTIAHRVALIASRIAYPVAQAIRLQLFLALCCLPITTYWGLVIPYLSPLGNLFFIPFLALFIMLGLVILIGHFLGLPLSIPAFLLNQLTNAWVYLLHTAPYHAYMVIPAVLFPLTLCGPFITFYTIRAPRLAHNTGRQILVTIASFTTLITVAQLYRYCTHEIIHVRRAQVGATILSSSGSVAVIDWGGVNAIPGGLSWVQYELSSQLYMQTGTATLAYLIIVHPIKKVRGTLYAFARRFSIDTIIVPNQQSTALLTDATLAGNPTILSLAQASEPLQIGSFCLQLSHQKPGHGSRKIALSLLHGTKHVNLYHVWRQGLTQISE